MTTLVLLPGLDGTGLLFEPLMAALSGAVSIAVVKYPPAPSAGYAELEQVARASLPARGPLILLGESFSGPIAIRLAANNPERVAGLVLCCTFARNPYPALSPLTHLMRLAPLKWLPTRLAASALFGGYATTALRASLASALAEVSGAALQSRLKAVLSVEVSADLARVNTPILYLRAKHDHVIPRWAGSHIAAVQPAVRVVDVPGPHGLLQVAPLETAREIRQFLDSLDQAAAP